MIFCYFCDGRVPVHRDKPDPVRDGEGRPVVFCCAECEDAYSAVDEVNPQYPLFQSEE